MVFVIVNSIARNEQGLELDIPDAKTHLFEQKEKNTEKEGSKNRINTGNMVDKKLSIRYNPIRRNWYDQFERG